MFANLKWSCSEKCPGISKIVFTFTFGGDLKKTLIFHKLKKTEFSKTIWVLKNVFILEKCSGISNNAIFLHIFSISKYVYVFKFYP